MNNTYQYHVIIADANASGDTAYITFDLMLPWSIHVTFMLTLAFLQPPICPRPQLLRGNLQQLFKSHQNGAHARALQFQELPAMAEAQSTGIGDFKMSFCKV